MATEQKEIERRKTRRKRKKMCQAIKRIRISSVLHSFCSCHPLPSYTRAEIGTSVQKYYDIAEVRERLNRIKTRGRVKKLYFFTIIADILFGYCVLAGCVEITRLKANFEREHKMLLVMVDKK